MNKVEFLICFYFQFKFLSFNLVHTGEKPNKCMVSDSLILPYSGENDVKKLEF